VPFAALEFIALLSGKASAMTSFWVTCFFWIRLTDAVVYLFGIAYVRTPVFTLGFVAVTGILRELIQ
jgi:uncharacterized MAPEG superfamily protein